jgi:membrane-bound lytic murein transglycosylase D
MAVALLSGCVTQGVRESSRGPSAEQVAGHAVLVEPGPPPPDMVAPGDEEILERLRRRAAERQARIASEKSGGRFEDVWGRIRAGLRLPRVEHPSVDAELAWYVQRPDYIRRTTDRARLYLAFIVHEAQRRNLPMELALLPIVESAFQPYARSPAGAMGIWQFIRSTGHHYGLKQSAWYDARRDILASTRAAFDYLEKLNRDMDGDWMLAVAAYNAGEGNVLRAVQRNRARGQHTDFFALQLPAETRAYVPRLLAISRLVAAPHEHGITLDPIDDEPFFARVDVGSQIDLSRAAELAGITLNELLLLNPGFMRHATDPSGPHHLLVPADSAHAFRTAFAALAPQERMGWSVHAVARGDTLVGIARQYGTSVDSLRAANDVQGSRLAVGQSLKVPAANGATTLSQLSPEVRAGIERAVRNEQRREYKVRAGDSLWSVAHQHQVPLHRLMSWNGLDKRSVLRPGQKLVIYSQGANPEAAASATARPPAAEARPTVHVVRSGDSLWNIARRYDIATEDLAQWNGISVGDTLHPGQQLRLSPPRSA